MSVMEEPVNPEPILSAEEWLHTMLAALKPIRTLKAHDEALRSLCIEVADALQLLLDDTSHVRAFRDPDSPEARAGERAWAVLARLGEALVGEAR